MTNGTEELLKLADLLRLGANTARDIASTRKIDSQEVCALADRADDIADDLEKLLDLSEPNRVALARDAGAARQG